jgi:CDP-4-dehydro-6-deoxyglucose reductase
MQIKERAFGRRVRERMLPSQEILSQRLYEQSTELADLRAHLQRYHAMMEAVRGRIGETGGAARHGRPRRLPRRAAGRDPRRHRGAECAGGHG